MLVSTVRYAAPETRKFARIFSASIGSEYVARGKKTVEGLVALSRKKGERVLALASAHEISFISVSVSNWEWKNESIGIISYVGEGIDSEIESISGPDSAKLISLFGWAGCGGEIEIKAGNGIMEFISEEGKKVLEIMYEIRKFAGAEAHERQD